MLNVAAHMMACRRRRVAAGVVDPPMGVRLCPGDDRPCHEHAREGTCGVEGAVVAVVGLTVSGKPAETPAGGRVKGMERLGPILWRRLHMAQDADRAWLDKFEMAIPCGECKKHWREVLAEDPPEFGGGWFAWTWRVHNAVNVRLGMPELSLAEAEAVRDAWAAEPAPEPPVKPRRR